jgi:hypothetical protein
MGQDAADENLVGLVIDPGDQPVSVALDVEDRARAHRVSRREHHPNVVEIRPACLLRNLVPGTQRPIEIGMPFCRFKPSFFLLMTHTPTFAFCE